MSKKISTYTDGNRNRDLPPCMPVPVTPTVAPMNKSCHQNEELINVPLCGIYIYYSSLEEISAATSCMRGRTEKQLIETLRYKPEGRGFDSICYHWKFYWHILPGRTLALWLTQPPTETSTGNIALGGKGGLWTLLTSLPHSCADCLEIWETQTPAKPRTSPGM